MPRQLQAGSAPQELAFTAELPLDGPLMQLSWQVWQVGILPLAEMGIRIVYWNAS